MASRHLGDGLAGGQRCRVRFTSEVSSAGRADNDRDDQFMDTSPAGTSVRPRHLD